ncbi:bifunctional copper resistance protein CopD/cytochrome c oxidase assembly protein [Kineosporiaceae bacterium SCSIO 59966]|nr:bifunctional copper resistance protein CopD/cytochrome c oxidase assembly protein [Kineosporiaceae bacterium SCSIO 59966]
MVGRAAPVGLLALILGTPAVAIAALAATTGTPAPLPGLPDAGSVTTWGLPAARAVRDVAAAVTVGLLVLSATVLPSAAGSDPDLLAGARRTAARFAAIGATVWAWAAAAVIAFTYSEAAGLPLSAPGTGSALWRFVVDFELGRWLAVSVALVGVTATGAWLATRTTSAGLLTLTAIASLLPLALSGHAGSAGNHETAVDTQAVHLVAASTWVGGLTGLALLRRHLSAAHFAVAVGRFSTLATWCFALVGISGVIGAAVRVDSLSGLRTSYGSLLAAKTAALVLLGGLGWLHRRRVVAALGDPAGRGRWFARLAVVEVVVMAVAVGLAVALGRTSPVRPGLPQEALTLTESLLGYPMPPPLGFEQWFSQWRIDPLFTPLAVAAAAWYLSAVLRLRRRGDAWPTGRATAWIVGCAVLVWATSAGPAVYGRVLFSMHMVQHMTIGTLVPIMLVLGAPVTLALRTLRRRTDGSRGPREWILLAVHSRLLRAVGHPVVAPVLFIGSLLAFYYTPALDLSMRTHSGHVLMTAHFIVVGYLFAWVICGPDPGPTRPAYPLRLVILIATMAFHAFVGISMMGSTEVLAEEWFSALDRPWGPTLAEDQYTGGALFWALGDYPVAILAVAMAVAWHREDAREARRYDRRAARDGDAELAAYNAWLQERAAGDQAS